MKKCFDQHIMVQLEKIFNDRWHPFVHGNNELLSFHIPKRNKIELNKETKPYNIFEHIDEGTKY